MVPLESNETTVDWDAIFRALNDRHRRRLLVNLLDHNPQDDRVQIPGDVHRGEKAHDVLEIEFVHKHLPTLEAQGFIRWDRDSHEIVKGPTFEGIAPLLELIRDNQGDLPDGWL